MKLQGVKYKLLDETLYLKFIQAYKQFYLETEKKEMPAEFQQNWILQVIQQMKNPECLYLLAVLGKKVLGFVIVIPLPSLDGVKSAFCDPLYVMTQYRNHEIGVELYKTACSWAKQKDIKKVYTYENMDSNFWSKKKLLGFQPFKKVLVKEV